MLDCGFLKPVLLEARAVSECEVSASACEGYLVEKGLSPGDTGASVNRPGRADHVLLPHQHIILNPAFTGGTNTAFGNPSHPGDIVQYASPQYLPAQAP